MFFPKRERPRPSPAQSASMDPAPSVPARTATPGPDPHDFAPLGADLAFETDLDGRLLHLAPAIVLGHPAATLIGTDTARLLRPSADRWDPFRAVFAETARTVRLRHEDGRARVFSVSVAPVLDPAGTRTGTRGVGHDVTAAEAAAARAAAQLRRAEATLATLDDIRAELSSNAGLRALLASAVAAHDAAGAAILRLTAAPPGTAEATEIVVATTGDPRAQIVSVLPLLRELARRDTSLSPDPGRSASRVVDGVPILAGHILTRFAEDTLLVLWREHAADPFTDTAERIVRALLGPLRLAMEHEMVQRHLAVSARTDPLTGVLNARAFAAELPRYIDRLDRDREPGTMLHADLDRFRAVNEAHGPAAGDRLLAAFADLLRRTVRPTDVVARLGGNVFAVWLQGADHLTAAERAERLRVETPGLLRTVLADPTVRALSVSIGIASRRPGGDETADDLMIRAAETLAEVKASGAAHWRVAPQPAA